MVFRLKLRAEQSQSMAWQHSSVRLEGPLAVAVTQPERQLG